MKVLQSDAAPNSVILDGYNWAVGDILENSRQNVSAINLSLGNTPTDPNAGMVH